MKLRITVMAILLSSLFYSQQIDIQMRDNASTAAAGTKSGFFQTWHPQNFPPDHSNEGDWWYLIDARHDNSPQYAMQFSGFFWDQNLWFRKINDQAPNQAWSKVLLENPDRNVEISNDLKVNNDIKTGGSNSWIFHTPDDGRTKLYIVPKKTETTWDWDKQTVFDQGNIAVSGKLEAREVKVTQTPTADFVLEDDYNLPKLEDVEKHIREKKHLPEIASAKDMEKEGVNVGEFQIKLLQKIEELTLYTIEQNKQLKNQSEELKQLKEENKNLKVESAQIRLLSDRIENLEKSAKKITKN